jgi:hypothetical protein
VFLRDVYIRKGDPYGKNLVKIPAGLSKNNWLNYILVKFLHILSSTKVFKIVQNLNSKFALIRVNVC